MDSECKEEGCRLLLRHREDYGEELEGLNRVQEYVKSH
ncbi:hypothetical protein ACP70R_015263 [Stipagrostis hirtigluma subsp. patula]